MTVRELKKLLDDFDNDRSVWIKVTTSKGKFSAMPAGGLDMLALNSPDPYDRQNPVAIEGIKL